MTDADALSIRGPGRAPGWRRSRGRQGDLRPALIASLLLHLSLVAAGLIAWPWLKTKPPPPPPPAVSVTLVAPSSAPDVRLAVKAPEPASAQAPEPAPEATAPPSEVESPAPPAPRPITPPAPKPRPAPPPPEPEPHRAKPPQTPALEPEPAPEPKPKPTPKPAASKPVPTPKPVPKRPVKPAKTKPDLNLDDLAASLPKTKPIQAAKPSHSLNLDAIAGAPAKSRTKAAKPGFDLAALADTLPASAKAGGSRHAAGAKGAARPETATEARPSLGASAGLSADSLAALRAKLERLWRPNCGQEGATAVLIKVQVQLTADGRLATPPKLVSETSAGADSGVVEASAQRALSAVQAGEPYTEVPRTAPRDIVLRFDAKHACAGR